MLQALSKHKISHEIRNQVWNLEDEKTSSIIGSMLHLPTDLFWEIILRSASPTDEQSDPLPAVGATGEILDYEFWPYWMVKDKVEPDVFISFEKFDIIIELKVHDYNKQKSWQWKREFEAYRKRYPEENKPVYLVAISGKTEEKLDHVYQCSWQSLLESTIDVNKSYRSNNPSSNIIRVFEDILLAFTLHKEYAFKYLDSVYLSESHIQSDYKLFPTLV